MYIGIDLGGTNIAVGLVDANLKILAQDSCPTLSERPYQEIVQDMATLCQKVVQSAGYTMEDIQSIGVGSPGTVDSKSGEVVRSSNLNWNYVPLVKELKSHFPNHPIGIANDANAAAYGEYLVSGEGADSFIAVTLGTGIGGGIILNKKIYDGFNGAAGEIGHFTLSHGGDLCTCGKRGCWERYASVTALVSQTNNAICQNPDSLLAKIAEERGVVNGRTAFDAAKAGDPVGQEVVSQYLVYVADGLASLINIFQPEILVLGGGISREGDYLLQPIRDYVQQNIYTRRPVVQTQLKVATLFNDAGIIGAALAAKG